MPNIRHQRESERESVPVRHGELSFPVSYRECVDRSETGSRRTSLGGRTQKSGDESPPRAVHFLELRTRVAALRAREALDGSVTSPELPSGATSGTPVVS